ncbi:PH domain-containing protein [Kitasatospora atroaurantiaca]|uniref:PH (Pleckstrin Homology) domain-containing protein n=1 Tax=Kitasatospora atroaurantiaca TaxID=285545 RepID=A0A561EPY6_9ACTN|nr:PH domain-containing protein [Kitasatospora atroaurantiaca]TWE17675.1 PH (Pleckstrin Homology) domain-containing protein [Kitasatospora atroaurantiaca]
MTESDGKPDPGSAASEPNGEQKYADRVYRSVPGIISGVLLLCVAGWLIIDAVVTGTGRTPWIALAAAPVFAFPVIAYTVRPTVLANERRLLVRNPLRTITAPWASVEGLKAGYSVELFAGGKRYQVWAVPVSLRQRKRATRLATRAAATGEPSASRTPSLVNPSRVLRPGESDPTRAWSDQVVETLQELAERNAALPGAAGPVVVRWCWWIIVPTLLGLIALVTLIVAG